MKAFFYPAEDFLKISAIPTDRKYNISRDMAVNVEGIEDLIVKYQPHKTNSELIYEIDEQDLAFERIEKVATYFVNRVKDMFGKLKN